MSKKSGEFMLLICHPVQKDVALFAFVLNVHASGEGLGAKKAHASHPKWRPDSGIRGSTAENQGLGLRTSFLKMTSVTLVQTASNVSPARPRSYIPARSDVV